MTKGCFYHKLCTLELTMALLIIKRLNLFNKFFYSIFNNSSDLTDLEPLQSNCSLPSTLSNISFTSHDIYAILTSLDPNKVLGTDNINPKILKYCANLLCDPIHHLFQACFTNSYISTDWCTHCVTPIFKSGTEAMFQTTVQSPYCVLSLIRCLKRLILMLPLNFFPIDSLHTNLVFCRVDSPSSSYSSSLMTYLIPKIIIW